MASRKWSDSHMQCSTCNKFLAWYQIAHTEYGYTSMDAFEPNDAVYFQCHRCFCRENGHAPPITCACCGGPNTEDNRCTCHVFALQADPWWRVKSKHYRMGPAGPYLNPD